jgi:hypothetical protein
MKNLKTGVERSLNLLPRSPLPKARDGGSHKEMIKDE